MTPISHPWIGVLLTSLSPIGAPLPTQTSRYTDASGLVVVSPDVGGVARARAFAKKLGDAPLAIVDKRRQAHNVAKVYNLIGDVEGKTCVLVDDMIDTAGTLSAGAALLKDRVRASDSPMSPHGNI